MAEESFKYPHRYVLGFAFDEDLSHVLLCKKNRPAWQAGMLNGLGGKIEEGEEPIDAMMREFEEESGITNALWSSVGRRGSAGDYEMYLFAGLCDLASMKQAVHFETDEPVICMPYSLDAIRNQGVVGLAGLVDLCLCSAFDGAYLNILDGPQA